MANQIDERVKPFEVKMGKSIASLDSEFGTIRAGRANPHVLDKIKVDYYGTPTPIQQVGNISVPEARMILIQPWEKSSGMRFLRECRRLCAALSGMRKLGNVQEL